MNTEIKNKIWLQISSTFQSGGWTMYEGGRNSGDAIIFKETEIEFHDFLYEEIQSIPCEFIDNTIKHEFGPYEWRILSEGRLLIKYFKWEFVYISCSDYSRLISINKEELEKKLKNKLWNRSIEVLEDNIFNYDGYPPKKLESREMLILSNQEYNSYAPDSDFKTRINLGIIMPAQFIYSLMKMKRLDGSW